MCTDCRGDVEPESEPDDEDVYADDPAGPFRYLYEQVASTRAELREWMEAEGYYPNVYWISDHGNVHPILDIHDATKD
ncbi:MAG: hypothetical protein ACREL7_05960 [Longimicrobiales bacterium]